MVYRAIIFSLVIIAFLAGIYYLYSDSRGTVTEPPQSPKVAECKATGCSGQVCSDEDVITTCEYRPEYACYKNARCERQIGGYCGWTENTDLKACLSNSGSEFPIIIDE